MIIIKRSSGGCLNLSSCITMCPYNDNKDTIVTYPERTYIIHNLSIDEITNLTRTTWSPVVILDKEFIDTREER